MIFCPALSFFISFNSDVFGVKRLFIQKQNSFLSISSFAKFFSNSLRMLRVHFTLGRQARHFSPRVRIPVLKSSIGRVSVRGAKLRAVSSSKKQHCIILNYFRSEEHTSELQ